MDPLVVISPHMDDGCLSVGQLIGSWPGAHVLTVATHAPEEPMSTEYDRNCGFSTAREACYRRRQEDHRALTVLGATPIHLGMRDGQYGTQETAVAISNRIAGALADIDPRVILAPLGLAHPDHEAVAEACRILCAQRQYPHAEWWVYEELPARVLWPEKVPEALSWWGDVGTLELGFLGTSDIERKAEAVECYESQLWALDRHAVLCPERIWQVKT